MSAEETIAMLLMSAEAPGQLGRRQWRRVAARTAWVREIMRALRQAQRAMDDRCTEAVDQLDEAAFNRLFEAEQAKVDAIRAQIDAVIDHDKWPRHLYFGGV